MCSLPICRDHQDLYSTWQNLQHAFPSRPWATYTRYLSVVPSARGHHLSIPQNVTPVGRTEAGCLATLGSSAPGALGRTAPWNWGSDVCGDLCWHPRGRVRWLGAGPWVAGAGNTCQAGSPPRLVPRLAEPNRPTEQIPWSRGWQPGTGRAQTGGAGGGGSPERRTLRPPEVVWAFLKWDRHPAQILGPLT